MATKADFTEEEWKNLQKGITGSGMLVSVSDKGFIDAFKEARALAGFLSEARKKQDDELVGDLAEIKGTGFGFTDSPQEVEQETLAALSSAIKTLEAKAPDEKEPYRKFVLDVAESVANAAKGMGASETGAIDKIKSALGSDGAATGSEGAAT